MAGGSILLAHNPPKWVNFARRFTHYRRGRQKRRCYRIEETGGLVRLSKASLAGSELLSSAKGAASPVLAEFLVGQGG
mgnify:CR=1 FL=1